MLLGPRPQELNQTQCHFNYLTDFIHKVVGYNLDFDICKETLVFKKAKYVFMWQKKKA